MISASFFHWKWLLWLEYSSLSCTMIFHFNHFNSLLLFGIIWLEIIIDHQKRLTVDLQVLLINCLSATLSKICSNIKNLQPPQTLKCHWPSFYREACIWIKVVFMDRVSFWHILSSLKKEDNFSHQKEKKTRCGTGGGFVICESIYRGVLKNVF